VATTLPQTDVLGRLLVIQNTLDVMGDVAGMSAFVARALRDLPGVDRVVLCMERTLYPGGQPSGCAVCCRTEEPSLAWGKVGASACGLAQGSNQFAVRVATARRVMGCIAFTLTDRAAFAAYEPFIGNIANVLANQIESRDILDELRRARDALEGRVAERTRELEAEVTMHRRSVERQRLFRSIMERSHDAIFIIDPATGGFVDVNETACQRLGYDRESLLGMGVMDIEAWVVPDRAAWTVLIERQRQAGSLLIEGQHRRRDGTTFPVEVSASNVVLGDMEYSVAVVRDITTRKEGEQELMRTLDELTRSNTELERFAYIASHDLREPLRTVISFSQLLERRCKDSLTEEGREYLEFIVGGARRMNTLIQDLLIYSRVGTRGRAFEPTDANLVMREVVDILAQAVNDHGATVTWGELPSVMAHRSQLNQILENLVGNALKFARHDVAPVITVTAARAGGMWDFAVADNGIGIEPQYFETIFVVFKRLHTEAAYPGSGIGLAICKRIVERHGGRIWVDSTLGQGSCFHFTILAAGTGE